MLQLALMFSATRAASRPVRKVTMKDAGILDFIQRYWMSGPIDQFLTGHKVDIGQSQDRVKELEETVLAVRPIEEPSRVEEKGEGSFGFGVVFQKVLGENLLDGGCVLFIVTAVSHGAGAAAHVFDGCHWNFPHTYKRVSQHVLVKPIYYLLTRVRLSGTRLDGTSMLGLEVQSIRPGRVRHRHGAVIVETVAVQHPEHGVSTHGQEGGPHTLDVFGVDPGIPDQHFGHANDLVGPLLFVEVGAVRMGDSVGCHFMAIGIKILHLAIVCPLVRNVECCL